MRYVERGVGGVESRVLRWSIYISPLFFMHIYKRVSVNKKNAFYFKVYVVYDLQVFIL